MSINQKLLDRNQGQCELCNAELATIEYTVSPKNDDSIENQVAIGEKCSAAMDNKEASFHWRCLEGSIWNSEPSVQALSYRILFGLKEEGWANDLINLTDYDENTIQWALSAYEKTPLHIDAFGNTLEAGDTVVLTKELNVKGTNFTASKGTVVKRIKLVSDNTDQIEGKINDQTIVILTKFVKKSV
jgi:protein PhnA